MSDEREDISLPTPEEMSKWATRPRFDPHAHDVIGDETDDREFGEPEQGVHEVETVEPDVKIATLTFIGVDIEEVPVTDVVEAVIENGETRGLFLLQGSIADLDDEMQTRLSGLLESMMTTRRVQK